MKLKVLLRPLLSVVFGIIGSFIVKIIVPTEIFTIGGNYFLILAIVAFGILGFILPELVEFAGRAGIKALAVQIVGHLPNPAVASWRSPISVPSLPFRRKRKNQNLQKYVNPLIVDTSALVDGRLAEVAKTGFIFGTFLVIPSVVAELHKLADSADEIRRGRGRRGLDVLSEIQSEKKMKVVILFSEPKEGTVDEKLILLAKKTHAKIVTVDYNLNKVAKVRRIEVLNINELASAVKTVVLPQERLRVQISAHGRGKDQGVGYLEDGTMVVVEEGAGLVGKMVDVVVHRVLQTAAGKMIFAKLEAGA